MTSPTVLTSNVATPKAPYTFEVFKGLAPKSNQWYWRLRAPNGKIVADGSEGYARKSGAQAAVRRVWKNLVGWGVLTWKA